MTNPPASDAGKVQNPNIKNSHHCEEPA